MTRPKSPLKKINDINSIIGNGCALLLTLNKKSMVNLATARGLNAEYFKLHSASALIVGGTSGIGQSIAFKIAQYTQKPLIVVSGRDEVRGQETIDALKAINKEGSYSFEKCDLTKMKDSRMLANKLAENHQSFNLLIISSGFLSMKPRTETEDGIDEKLAVNFFGRFNLMNRMMPMLTTAANQGQRVTVLSVFAAGEGRSLDLNDIGLMKNFSLASAASHASNCNDLMTEVLHSLFLSRHLFNIIIFCHDVLY
jgi:NAD(P)-dependent dehydrogenase (short-subunit alcohol dehydrogenase family)